VRVAVLSRDRVIADAESTTDRANGGNAKAGTPRQNLRSPASMSDGPFGQCPLTAHRDNFCADHQLGVWALNRRSKPDDPVTASKSRTSESYPNQLVPGHYPRHTNDRYWGVSERRACRIAVDRFEPNAVRTKWKSAGQQFRLALLPFPVDLPAPISSALHRRMTKGQEMCYVFVGRGALIHF
jgi:hypothetical protein